MKLSSRYSASVPGQSPKVLHILFPKQHGHAYQRRWPHFACTNFYSRFISIMWLKKEKLLQRTTWGKRGFICLKILVHNPLYGGRHSIRSLRQLVTTPPIKSTEKSTQAVCCLLAVSRFLPLLPNPGPPTHLKMPWSKGEWGVQER